MVPFPDFRGPCHEWLRANSTSHCHRYGRPADTNASDADSGTFDANTCSTLADASAGHAHNHRACQRADGDALPCDDADRHTCR